MYKSIINSHNTKLANSHHHFHILTTYKTKIRKINSQKTKRKQKTKKNHKTKTPLTQFAFQSFQFLFFTQIEDQRKRFANQTNQNQNHQLVAEEAVLLAEPGNGNGNGSLCEGLLQNPVP